MTKVRIDTPGVTVEIESDESLDRVARKALKLFNDAGGWPLGGAGGGYGFSAERRSTEAAQPSSMPEHPYPFRIQQ